MSDAPLSELMAEMRAGAPGAYERFLEAFLTANVGIAFQGRVEVPTPGNRARVRDGHMPVTELGGKRGIRVCADPDVFRARFGPKFNVLVDGATALDIAANSPDCEAVFVNSALAEHSAVIDRPTILRLVAAKARRWWKFW